MTIKLTRSAASLADIFGLVGKQGKDIGSGLFKFHYTLQDGSLVILSYGHPKQINITHVTSDLKNETIPVK